MRQNYLKRLFTSFLDDDYHQEIRTRNFSYILGSFAVTGFLVASTSLVTHEIRDGILGVISGIFFLAMLWLCSRGYKRFVSVITLIYLTLLSTLTMITGAGLHDIAIIIMPMTLSLGSLLLSRIPFIFLIITNALALVGIGFYMSIDENKIEAMRYCFRNEDILVAPILLIATAIAIRLMNGNYLFAMDKIFNENRNRKELVDAINEGVFLLDADSFRILDYNEYAISSLGFKAVSLSNAVFDSVFPYVTAQKSKQTLCEVLVKVKDGKSISAVFFFEKLGDRSDLWLDFCLQRVELNQVTHILAVVRDISDTKKMAEELHLSKHLSALGLLAGGVAHDFNNQLSGIMGLAELIERSENLDDIKKYTSMIMKCSEASATLTSQLLAFASMGKNISTNFSFQQLLQDAFDILNHSLPKNIECVFEDECDKDVVVYGDAGQLQNVLVNLAINARDAMPHGGRLTFTLSYSKESGRMSVVITDTGSGIDDEHIDRIFEPFFTTKEFGSGTGMGLAASYGIIKEHNGDICVLESSTFGTSFQIMLPASQNDTDLIGRSEDVDRYEDAGACIIYYIDDEEMVRTVTCSLLEARGFSVKAFSTVNAAINEFEKNALENIVLLIDRDMPEINGIEGVKMFRAIRDNLPAIICSGICDEELFESYEWLKHDTLFVQKPCPIEKLVDTINKIQVLSCRSAC